jgi:hypothetical protein
VYARLAQRHSLFVCMLAGITAYLVVVAFVLSRQWLLWEAVALHLIVVPVCMWLVRDLRDAPMQRVAIRWQDIAMRAVGVAILVAAVVTLSFRIGPQATGFVAAFPIIYSSIMIILYRRVGGRAAAAVMAQGMPGLLGFGCALTTLHLAAVPFGTPAALGLALAVAVAWNLSLFAFHRLSARTA